jgi:8-oxo-dGTP pyrophosphatase MutT (NUDIX family)
MRHAHRWDLPKGRSEAGEDDLQTALRETFEETGIPQDALTVDPDFRHEVRYRLPLRNRPKESIEKRVVYFLGFLLREVEIQLTEHPSYRWFRWSPPHRIQAQTVDPLLSATELHLQSNLDRLSKYLG